MTIKPRPVFIDPAGFQRRAWEFEYRGSVYYIQETAQGYDVVKQDIHEQWQAIEPQEAAQVIAAFQQAHGPDKTGLRE